MRTRKVALARGSDNAWHGYVFFLIWPFFSLMYAIINWRSKWSKNIVWLFCGFFGYTFVISNAGSDANRYRDYLSYLHSSNIGFHEYFQKVLSGEEYGKGDYLEPTIRYLVSILTDDYRMLFAAFGLFMGFFISRNIWALLGETGGRIRNNSVAFLMMFIFLVPFWQINGFRFWTAAHVFIYAIFNLFIFRRLYSSIWLFLLSILTHISFILPVSLVLVYWIIPKKNWILLILFFTSLLLVRLDLSFFIDIIPEKLQGPQVNLVKGYLLEDYAARRSVEVEALNWYARYRYLPIYLYTILIATYFLTRGRNSLHFEAIRNLFYFGLFLFCVTNLISVIPSSGRFFILAYMCIFGALFLLMHKLRSSGVIRILFWAGIFFVILPILVEFRIGMMFIGPGLLVYNPLYAWIMENKIAFLP